MFRYICITHCRPCWNLKPLRYMWPMCACFFVVLVEFCLISWWHVIELEIVAATDSEMLHATLWHVVEPGMELLKLLQQQTLMLYTTPVSLVGGSNHSQSPLSTFPCTFLWFLWNIFSGWLIYWGRATCHGPLQLTFWMLAKTSKFMY